MNDLVIYGSPNSNYVRSARMAAQEKGVDYRLEVDGHDSLQALSEAKHLAVHPFARIPAARHGDRVIFETSAIMRYVDESFEGPSLRPADAYGRALMEEWISAAQDYVNAAFRKGIVIGYVFPSGPDGEPDRAAIAAAADKAAGYARIIDQALAARSFLAGEAISLADLMLAPMLSAARRFPEGEAALAPCPQLTRWLGTLAARPSFAATDPEKAQAA